MVLVLVVVRGWSSAGLHLEALGQPGLLSDLGHLVRRLVHKWDLLTSELDWICVTNRAEQG